MGKILETTINRFDGGITNDPRDPLINVARIISNLDVLTIPQKMTPYRSSEDGNTSQSTARIQSFGLGVRTGSTWSLFGLGVVPGGGLAEVYYKDLTTGSANDLDDNNWASTSNNASSAGTTSFNLFVYYRKTKKFYGARGGTAIWSYAPETPAWVDSAYSVTYTNVAQGLVHSKDDILYVPADNTILVNNNDSWSVGLTLPTHYVITSICEYGNYLAIGCSHLNGIDNSRVFLWDRDTTLTTVSESIEWGSGSLMILEQIDGILIGISQSGGLSSFSGLPNASASFGDKIIFRAYTGSSSAEKIKVLTGSTSTLLPITKLKVDGRLYFLMVLTFNGSVRDGVFSFGRSAPSSAFALIHERTSNNNTALVSSDTVKGFYSVTDFLFISYTTAGVYAMSKTDDQANYTANGIYESKKFNAGDSSLKKDLIGITIKHEFLPTGGSVAIKYRVDQNTSWTSLFTNSTANSISSSVSSQSGLLPKDYKEIEFQILVTGANVEVTGFSFTEEITGKRQYE